MHQCRVSLLNDRIIFNLEVCLNLCTVEGTGILHSAHTHTRYQNVIFSKSLSAKHAWEVFMEAGVTVYAGYSNRITTDQGSLFTSKYWDDIVALHRIDLELSGIES